jgi:hypothetical protein
MKRESLAALLHVLAWVVASGVSALAAPYLTNLSIMTKPLGSPLFLLSVAACAWTLVRLMRAFFSNVKPTIRYFYAPWACLHEGEVEKSRDLLVWLCDGLHRAHT